MSFGLPELIIILVILLLLFGANRLPKLSRSIGQSAKELREGLEGPVGSKKQASDKTDKKHES